MQGGKLTSLLFVDISIKAFDYINLGKLGLSRMSGRTLGWFKSYLADRQQSVYVNGELSETHQIALGSLGEYSRTPVTELSTTGCPAYRT